MTLAEAAPPPLNLASWNLCVLGVAVAGNTMHAEFVPMSQCMHLAIVACVDSLYVIRTTLGILGTLYHSISGLARANEGAWASF